MAAPSRTRQYQQTQLLLVYHRILNVKFPWFNLGRALMGLAFHCSIPEHDGLCSSYLMSFQRPHTEATRPWTGPLSSECSLGDARPGQRPNVVQQRSAFVPLVVASQVTCLFFSFALFFFGTVRIEFVVVITSLGTDRSNTILYGEQAGCAAVISYLALVCCHTLDLRCYLVNNCIIHMAPCV